MRDNILPYSADTIFRCTVHELLLLSLLFFSYLPVCIYGFLRYDVTSFVTTIVFIKHSYGRIYPRVTHNRNNFLRRVRFGLSYIIIQTRRRIINKYTRKSVMYDIVKIVIFCFAFWRATRHVCFRIRILLRRFICCFEFRIFFFS